MIVNLSYDTKEIDRIVNQSDRLKHTILDMVGVCRYEGFNIQYARNIDKNQSTELRALENYISDIGKLSRSSLNEQENIRTIEINGLPLYWLTPISIKHDSMHWGQTVYYFQQFLIDYPKFFEKEEDFIIILPKSAAYLKTVIQDLFKKQTGKTAKIECLVHAKKSFFQVVRIYLHFASNYFKLKSKLNKVKTLKKDSQLPINQFLIHKNEQATTNNLSQYASSFGKVYKIPVLWQWKDLIQYDWSIQDKNLISAYPNLFDFFQLIRKTISTYFKIKSAKDFSLNILSSSFTFSSIQTEFHHVALNIRFFFNHLWLKKYFKSLNQATKVFYEDEFYASGRIVSASKNNSSNSLVTTIGVQHGLITKDHTVYKLSQNELTNLAKNDALPIPDKFAVWGKYFKKEFLSYNNLPEKYVLETGNLKYIKQRQKHQKNNFPAKKKLTLLWCTTLKTHTIAEYQLIKTGLLEFSDKVELLIRLHPGNHLDKDFIHNLIDKKLQSIIKFSSQKEIIADFNLSDVVISTMLSTVFLDALVAKKIVFRIITPIAFCDFKNLKDLYDVRTEEGFNSILTEVFFNKKHLEKTKNLTFSNLIHTKDDVWKSIFSEGDL